MVASESKKVLILGAGYVSEPVVEYLTRDSNVSVTLGMISIERLSIEMHLNGFKVIFSYFKYLH